MRSEQSGRKNHTVQDDFCQDDDQWDDARERRRTNVKKNFSLFRLTSPGYPARPPVLVLEASRQ